MVRSICRDEDRQLPEYGTAPVAWLLIVIMQKHMQAGSWLANWYLKRCLGVWRRNRTDQNAWAGYPVVSTASTVGKRFPDELKSYNQGLQVDQI